MNFSLRSTETQFDLSKKLIVVSFGSGDMFPIHGLTIPFTLFVRLTLSIRVIVLLLVIA